MSKLLKETLIDNKKDNFQNLTSENGFFDTFVSKIENLDFKNVNIKLRSSPAYSYKCLNKVHEQQKYKGKIIFPIIETIIIDKGQVNHWIFTDDTTGYVMKKNSNKLIKDYILRYFVGIARQKIKENREDSERKIDRIMEDIHRYVILSDQNYSKDYHFSDDIKYLTEYKNLDFIFLKLSGNSDKFVNIFELFIMMADPNKLVNVILIQNFADIDRTKAIYGKFYRKNILAPKKFQLFTRIPNLYDTDSEEEKNHDNSMKTFHHRKKSENFSYSNGNLMPNNNNNSNVNAVNNLANASSNPNSNIFNSMNSQNIINMNLNNQIGNFSTNSNNPGNKEANIINNTVSHKNTNSKSNMSTLGPRKPKKKASVNNNYYDDDEIEKKKNIDMNELIALNDTNLTEYLSCISEPFVELLEKVLGIFIYEIILMYQKNYNGNFFFRLSDNILCKSRRTPEEIEEEKRLKDTMKNIHEKTIPKEIRKSVRKYERVTKNAFCFGEFCNYKIPKFFKNMNKFNKEDLIEYNNIDTKLIERNKNHDFAVVIPYFLIKKAYDNENLVNIVLKAYSIFPDDFNKDKVLSDLQRARQLDEQRKEEENKKEAERLKMEEKMKRMGTTGNSGEEIKNGLNGEKKIKNFAIMNSIGPANSTNLMKNSLKGIISISGKDKDKINSESEKCERKIIVRNIDHLSDDDEPVENTEENKTAVTLYTPTQGKFLNFNFDKMYSKTHVCGNCNIIYMLIEDFLRNFEDGETQFKSLNKAKALLLQGEKLRNPFNMGDNIDVDENNDNLLFREEKTAFSLKKILKKKILEEKKKLENLNKPFVHQKLYKKIITKKDEFHKMFNYSIKMNAKLLQLNLLAEKSKNKFFNLILSELKNDPKTLNEKMGMLKPKKGYPKSLESLRMHMGINSKIMIDSEYKSILHLNSPKRRPNSKERLSAFRKSSNGDLKNSMNANNSGMMNKMDISVIHQDINIFQEYMKIKLNFKPEIKRLNSQILETNDFKSNYLNKKLRNKGSTKNSPIKAQNSQNNQEDELSDFEIAALAKRNKQNSSFGEKKEKNKLEIKEIIEHENEQYSSKNTREKLVTKQNSSINKHENNETRNSRENKKAHHSAIETEDLKDEKINSSDSDYFDVYKKNNGEEISYHESNNKHSEELNEISKIVENENENDLGNSDNPTLIKKTNTSKINKYEKDNDGVNGKNILQENKIKSVNSSYNIDSSERKATFERKYSIEDENAKRRISMENFKKNQELNFNEKPEENLKEGKILREKENVIKDRLDINNRSKIFNSYDKILFNIYEYFFPETTIEENLNQKLQQKIINRNICQEGRIKKKISEYYELKHYDSDHDIQKMRKFVYEKLEVIHKELVLKSKFNLRAKKSLLKNKNSNVDLYYDSINHEISNFADEEQDKFDEINTTYLQNNELKSKNFTSDLEDKRTNSNFTEENTGNLASLENNNKILIKIKHIPEENLIGECKNVKNNKKNSNKKDSDNKIHSSKIQEYSKKSYITSIFYYDWAKDPNKYDVPYYFMTTPIMRLNENNLPSVNNPLDEMKTMNFDDLIKIGKFNLVHITKNSQKIIKKAKVFVYDQFTAVPYAITDLRNTFLNVNQNRNENNNYSNLISPDSNQNNANFKIDLNFNIPLNRNEYNNNINMKQNLNSQNSNEINNQKKVKLLVVVLNDFYECFTNNHDLIINALGIFGAIAERFKIIHFNFPAQPFTLYNKKNTFNNIYYSKFLDRFLFHLIEKNIFDHTYSIIFVGFGNGGHIALNYVSANEKFFDFINSVILLNSYCENDENIGKSMLEITKVIENSKNENMIDFFIKSITYNPMFLTQFNSFNINKLSNQTNKNFNKTTNNLGSLNGVNENNTKVYNSFYNVDILSKINSVIPSSLSPKEIPEYNLNLTTDMGNKIYDRNSINPEEYDMKLSYLGYSLITKGYFYNIPFNHSEINTPIVALHTSNNCFIPLTNLNALFVNVDNNIDFNGLNNFAVKDPRLTLSPISSIDDFSQLSPENKVRRKLVVFEGAHNLIRENAGYVTMFLRNFFEYSFENVFIANK